MIEVDLKLRRPATLPKLATHELSVRSALAHSGDAHWKFVI